MTYKKLKSKRPIDSIDREILRVMYGAKKRYMSGTAIANKVNLSSPAIRPRLNNLQSKGIVKPQLIGGKRIFNRVFKNSKEVRKVIAPSKILWRLDIKKKIKR